MARSAIFVELLLFAFAMGIPLPDTFKLCPVNLPNRVECLKVAIQQAFPVLKDGLPSFKFPKLEPIEIPSLIIGNSEGAVHAVQNYKNLKLYGVSTIKVNNVNITKIEEGEIIVLDTFIEQLRLEADYVLDGQVLIFPIKGEGRCAIRLLNTTVIITFHYKDQIVKGTRYRIVENFLTNIDPKRIIFHFGNLFGGDKGLGDGINKLLNDEWRSVFWDVRAGYEEALSLVFKNLSNIIHTRASFKELYNS